MLLRKSFIHPSDVPYDDDPLRVNKSTESSHCTQNSSIPVGWVIFVALFGEILPTME